MKKSLIFAQRNFKEMSRDALSWIFCIALPLLLLALCRFVLGTIPDTPQNFLLQNFSGGILIFSFAFLTLFCGVLVSKDRSSSFLKRLYISPMRPTDFIAGYTLSAAPIALAQCVAVYLFSAIFGMSFTFDTLFGIILSMPAAVMFIALGIMLGSLLGDKSVSGVASVLVNVAALFSGMWFDLSLMGQTFSDIMHFLPFANAFDVIKFASAGQWTQVWLPFAVCAAWCVALFAAAVPVFNKKTKI